MSKLDDAVFTLLLDAISLVSDCKVDRDLVSALQGSKDGAQAGVPGPSGFVLNDFEHLVDGLVRDHAFPRDIELKLNVFAVHLNQLFKVFSERVSIVLDGLLRGCPNENCRGVRFTADESTCGRFHPLLCLFIGHLDVFFLRL